MKQKLTPLQFVAKASMMMLRDGYHVWFDDTTGLLCIDPRIRLKNLDERLVWCQQGEHGALDERLKLRDELGLGRGVKGAKLSYTVRFDHEFEVRYHGKLPGLSSIYSRFEGYPAHEEGGWGSRKPNDAQRCWSARVNFSPSSRVHRIKLGFYNYHGGQEHTYADNDNVGEFDITKDIHIEQSVTIDDTKGFVHLVISDGMVATNHTREILIQGPECPDEPEINEAWLCVYHGGYGPQYTWPRTQNLELSNIVLERFKP